ncbi:hypothetical protein LXL04_023948 [Taraxacum kok-saghyz]
MGYIAVSNDQFSNSIGRREICVVWRGSLRNYEFLDDFLGAKMVSMEPILPHDTSKTAPKVMEGWLTVYNTSDPDSEFVKLSARTQLLTQIKELLDKFKDEKVSITLAGHSLASYLYTLSPIAKVPSTNRKFAMGDATQSRFKPPPEFKEVERAPVIERWALLKLHVLFDLILFARKAHASLAYVDKIRDQNSKVDNEEIEAAAWMCSQSLNTNVVVDVLTIT